MSIESIFANPVLGFALALVLTAISRNLTATGANLMLAFAWILVSGSLYRVIPAVQPIPKVLFTGLAASVIGLVIYFSLWAENGSAIVNPLRFQPAEITNAPTLYKVAVPFVNGGPPVLPEFQWISGGVVSDRVLTAEAEEIKWQEFLNGPAGERGKWSLPEDLGVDDRRAFHIQANNPEELELLNSSEGSQLYLFGMASYRHDGDRYRVELCRRFRGNTWHTCYGHNKTLKEE